MNLEKVNKNRHVLISIHDHDCVRVGFLDNEKPGALHYYNDNWHRYLTEGSSTFDFTVWKGSGQDVSLLNEEAYVSFTFEYQEHLFKIRKIEETETELTCYCESTNLELLNEEAPVYEATKSLTLEEYFELGHIVGDTRLSNVVIGTNEVKKTKKKLSWSSRETKLARLLSVVDSFGAECEFVTELNRNGTLNCLRINIYKKHDDDHQGVGTRRVGKTLYYGEGINSIRRTVDITDIISSITPTGSKEVTTKDKDGKETKETKTVTLAGYPESKIYDSDDHLLYYVKNGAIWAPQTRDRFPSTLGPDSDKWIVAPYETDASTQDGLYEAGLAQLKILSEPSIEYEIEGDYDLDIGDTIIVHDQKFEPALILEARVSEQEYSFTDPTQCKNTFSNVKALENKLSSSILSRMQTLIDEATPIVLDVVIEGSTVMKSGSDASAVLTGRLTKGENEIYAESWTWYKDGEQISTGSIITIDADDISGSSVYRVEAVKGARTYTKTVTMTQVKDGLGIKDLKDQYTLSSSTSTNDGTDWSDTTVEYIDGKAVWSRYEITWDDGSTTYTSALYNPSATVGYQASFRCGELEADNANIKGSLSAHDAHFTELETDNANIKEKLTAAEGEITTLTSDNVTVKQRLTATEGNIDTLSTNLTTAQTLIAEKATITDLDAATGRIALLESGKADIGDLTAVSTKTNTLEAGVASINLLLSGSTVSGSTQTIVLNAENCTIDTAFFENLISSYVTAGYIFGDTISTNDFTIKSDDGGLEMADKTIQIKDSTRVRIQIGEDSSGDYNLYLWDEDGNLLWDAQGLTATGISRPIIKDSMVASNANIAGSKLDINSVVTSINNGTTTIKGTLVKLGDQTLDVAFNTLNTTVEGNTTTIQSQATSITAIQGQISSLITDVQQLNDTKADGSAVTTLTSNYNSLKQTVDGTVNDIGSLQTSITTKADNSTVTTIQNAQNTLSNTVDGLNQRIQSAEATIESKADGSTVETIQNNYNTLSNTVNGLESSVGSVTTTVNGTIANTITLFYSSDSTSVPALPTSKVTSTTTNSKTWTTVVPTYSASYPYLYTCLQQTTVAGNVTWTKVVSGSYSNYVNSVNSAANAGIKETTTLFYASATASAPSKPTSAVTTSNATTYGAWNKTLPTYSKNYPYLYLCTQTLTNGGTYAWTNVESGSYADYVSSLSSEQASLKTTVNSITSKVSNLTSAVGANEDGSLTTSLTDQISEVKQTASGIISTVSSLQVGGRNFVSHSKLLNNNYKDSSWPLVTTLGDEYKVRGATATTKAYYELCIPMYAEYNSLVSEVTISFECITSHEASTYTNLAAYNSSNKGRVKEFTNHKLSDNDVKKSTLADGWTRYVYTVPVETLALINNQSSADSYGWQIKIYGKDDETVEAFVRKPKVEIGNIATDWTPAPEDVESSITAVQEYASSIDQKADSITSTVSSVQNQLDSLEVGGRNLILKSETCKPSAYGDTVLTILADQTVSEWNTSNAFRVTGTKESTSLVATLATGRNSSSDPSPISVNGQNYVHSIYIKNLGDPIQFRNNSLSNTVVTVATNEVTRVVLTGTGDGVNYLQFTISIGSYNNIDFYYWHPQIELGSIVSDWTVAPEDTESEISSLGTRVSTAEQKITPDAITLAVNEYLKGGDGTRALTSGNTFTVTKDACIVEGGKFIIRGSGKSLEESLDITASGRNLVVDGEFSKTKTNTNLTKGSGVFPASWDYYNTALTNWQNIYPVYIDQNKFGYNVAVFNESDGTRHWKALTKSIVSGWGFDGSWDCYRLSIDVYATGAGTKLFGGFYYAREEDNGTRNFRSGQFNIPSSEISVGKWSRVSVEIPYNHDWDGTSAVTLFLYGHGFSANQVLYVKNISINNATVTCDFTRNTGEIQEEIDDAKSTATDAQKAADDAQDYAENVKSLADLAQAAADDASDLAKQSLEQANEALGVLSPWKCVKDGKTYIDGSNIYTGTINCAALNTETISALGAYISTLYTGKLKSQDEKLTISLLSGQEGIEIKNETLHTKLKVDADGTRVLNEDGTVVIAKFTADGTETANLIVSGTSYLSGLQLEKKDSGEIWAVYGG